MTVISLLKRARIISEHEAGLSSRKIAQKVGVNQRTVLHWLRKYKDDPLKNIPQPKVMDPAKRFRKITEANINTVRRSLARNPFLSSKNIWISNPSLHHLSLRSIRDICLKHLKVKTHRAAKKPGLTPKMIADRLRFCNLYKDWSEEDWLKVLFSDESTFRVGTIFPGVLVRRAKGSDRYNPRFTTRRLARTLTEGVTVWGCFAGIVCFVGAGARADCYRDILD